MFVKLPRRYSGKKIVEAFKDASTFTDNPRTKWEIEETIGKYRYELNPPRSVPESFGIQIKSFRLAKKWVFWGKEVWKRGLTTLTLVPVDPSAELKEVEIKIRHLYDFDLFGSCTIVKDSTSPGFEEIRLVFEKILERFHTALLKE